MVIENHYNLATLCYSTKTPYLVSQQGQLVADEPLEYFLGKVHVNADGTLHVPAFVLPHVAAVNCSYLVEGDQHCTQNYKLNHNLLIYGMSSQSPNEYYLPI